MIVSYDESATATLATVVAFVAIFVAQYGTDTFSLLGIDSIFYDFLC